MRISYSILHLSDGLKIFKREIIGQTHLLGIKLCEQIKMSAYDLIGLEASRHSPLPIVKLHPGI